MDLAVIGPVAADLRLGGADAELAPAARREDGVLDLDAPLGTFWDEAAGHPLGAVTGRQLLPHTADLPLRAQLKNLYGTDPADICRGVLHKALNRPPGEAVEYTDQAALILGYLAEHLSGQPLDQLCETRTWPRWA